MITSIPVFIGLTLVLFGGCAFMTGQALAVTWRPYRQVIPYTMMLGCADRFLGFALFEGELLSLSGWLLDSAVLCVIGLLAWRLTQVRRMADQYPWLYIRTGWLTLRRL
ncbi:hypothetical protein CCC_04052 [Paramagnetospirillum magnetotacticum MS-1]|uniref:DUF6867 domain-containing protein n=1 Tax=Paramagnetospirillum magnetotacticum MS-1 TaxID=272627 RepID=A0A0C2V370_PARME|nr:hypothetical protein [Paramagnetospirillum magnetotacticum]KIL99536.1 hypothetical protein CCC_04052 [Paramagnetospirillum magnetotacticum MS-1]